MMLDDIVKQINTIEDIRELRYLQDTIKHRREQLGSMLKNELSIGDPVTVSSSKGRELGYITKINRTRAVVDMRGSSYNVPFSMITKEQ